MGLSSKQVSSSGLDWKQTLLEAQNLELPKSNLMRKQQQQQQQQTQPSESLKCPRCDSSNTKFCYYNNYNKSQPRHFCRACKRHWTKGGTLRNVPVGGGRKNKRVKKSSITPITTTTSSTIPITTTAATSTCTATLTTSIGNNMDAMLGSSSHMTNIHQTPLADDQHKNMSSSLYQALIRPPPLLLQQNLINTRALEGKDFSIGIGIGNGMFSSSTLSLPLHQSQSLLFPFSTSSNSFDTNPCSVVSTSLRSSNNVYNYGEDQFKAIEEPTINSTTLTTTTTTTTTVPGTGGTNNNIHPSWEIAAATSGVGLGPCSNYWNWEDFDSLVSTDLKDPWDDSDIKP